MLKDKIEKQRIKLKNKTKVPAKSPDKQVWVAQLALALKKSQVCMLRL
jgi:hypothetical protein